VQDLETGWPKIISRSVPVGCGIMNSYSRDKRNVENFECFVLLVHDNEGPAFWCKRREFRVRDSEGLFARQINGEWPKWSGV
jgi:hypothetical protein